MQADCPGRYGKTESISVGTARTGFIATKEWLKQLAHFADAQAGSRVRNRDRRVWRIAANLNTNRRTLLRILDSIAQDVLDRASNEHLVSGYWGLPGAK
jgi:hypothetical protein